MTDRKDIFMQKMRSFPTLLAMTRRNVRLFFKDKGTFFTALVTPGILLLLYGTFLAKIYRDAFLASVPQGVEISKRLIDACVGGQLISSILAVSCVTVAFCSNMIMVQDRVNGTADDLTVSPVSPSILALSYYISCFLSTLIVCLFACLLCLIYLAVIGWYLSALDVLLLFADILVLCLFGTAFSSVVHFFLHTQGQISAVGTIVSACYGFICGAYMPISNFSIGLQRVVSFLPGTYGTSLLRTHALRGAFAAMEQEHFPKEVVDSIRSATDCSIQFFSHTVSDAMKWVVLIGTVVLLILIYILQNKLRTKRQK